MRIIRSDFIVLSFAILIVILCDTIILIIGNVAAFQQSASQISLPPTIVIKTKLGDVQGTERLNVKGDTFQAFEGIPYALPPIGNLRFQAPVPVTDHWSGVLNATSEGSPCFQLSETGVVGSEDCLFLNIYVPKVNSSHSLFPVMVYLHGGAFMVGHASMNFKVDDLQLFGNEVIIININYRLGILGFLSTGDDACPGNNGLKDQGLALAWIQHNIKEFGGDPKKVTLWGNSAGAASVHYHMLSPMSKGLFQRAISQSGTSLCWWSVTRNANRNALRLGAMFNCTTDCTKSMISCLQEQDVVTLTVSTQHFWPLFPYPLVAFGPVVESSGLDRFITEEPYILTKEGKVADVPWLTGFTTNEGAFLVAEIFEKSYLFEAYQSGFYHYVPLSLDYQYHPEREHITNQINHFYFNNQTLTRDMVDGFMHLWSDQFIHGVYRASLFHSRRNKNPIYLYHLTYRGRYSFTQKYAKTDKNYGISHMDDLIYLFMTTTDFNALEGQPERELAQTFHQLWLNFVKFGNPTPKEVTPSWTPMKPNEISYMNLNIQPKMDNEIPQNRMKFWDELCETLTRVASQTSNDQHQEL